MAAFTALLVNGSDCAVRRQRRMEEQKPKEQKPKEQKPKANENKPIVTE
ncbi:hypothetical protein SLEP1_g42393 [Rubroshorea leprosula]|uniref:Uncharacterized protein n=1 Tax=Rubroshorea leprosula TaxID=152421 RepID=A0AAV5L9P7_9ROSI|nr:hypothetical protein SLEP1_g42393 [Rubroshorea leprosula]